MERYQIFLVGGKKEAHKMPKFLGQKRRGLLKQDSLSESFCFYYIRSPDRMEWFIILKTFATLFLSYSVPVQVANMKIPPKFGIPTDPVLNEQILRHAGKISYARFQVSQPGSLWCGILCLINSRTYIRALLERCLASLFWPWLSG